MLAEIHWTALHKRYESLDTEDAKQLSGHIAAILTDTFLADCLKPVPVGEMCRLLKVRIGSHVIIDGTIFWYHGGDVDAHVGYLRSIPQMENLKVDMDEHCQPVRLVPALEALEGRDDE